MAFSDNIETIRGFAANAAQTAASKTRKLAGIAKANISILAEEEKVRKAQQELGKVYYKNFISGEASDLAEYLPLCEKITASLKLIEGLKAEIEQARNGSTGTTDAVSDELFTEEPAEKEAPVVPEIVVVEDAPEAAAEEAAPAEEPEAPEAPEA